jgi:4-hydroxy-4-methyl-2-oxoglutarate aldolase
MIDSILGGHPVSRLDLRATIEGLREFDTTLLANTIGYIDPTPAHEFYMGGSIQSVTPTLGPTVGVAVLCELDSSTPNGKPNVGDFWKQLEEMRKMDMPPVWVVKTVGKRPDHECVLGEGMAKVLYSVGCLGTVTDGGVRDLNGLLTTPFPVYCKGKTIHHCALRFKALTTPVSIGGITIAPGDLIHANAEGVIKIPHRCIPRLIPAAVKMLAFEHEAHSLLRHTELSPELKERAIVGLLHNYNFAAGGNNPKAVSKRGQRGKTGGGGSTRVRGQL